MYHMCDINQVELRLCMPRQALEEELGSESDGEESEGTTGDLCRLRARVCVCCLHVGAVECLAARIPHTPSPTSGSG